MHRLFKRHEYRRNFYLDWKWDFVADPDKVGKDMGWERSFPAKHEGMFVPSVWNTELGYYHYEGVAWYRTRFKAATPNINIVFHAVMTEAEVYLDGRYLGYHYGGFTPFSFLVTGLTAEEHELVVRVDNTHNAVDTIPLSKVDWFHYGGIIRSVEIMELQDIWIKNYRVDYSFDAADSVKLNIRVQVENLSNSAKSSKLSLYADGNKLVDTDIHVNPGLSEITINDLNMDGITRWDMENPRLYTIRFVLSDHHGKTIDDCLDRLGFREVKIQSKKVLLNGRQVFLKGVNRHEDHPDWGFAFPQKLIKKDIDIIKKLGCNTVRMSHYPNSEAFLDYCDETGILLWEEIPMWGFPKEVLANPRVMERGLAMHEEMVTRDYHHPSIIIWGMHNEIDSDTEEAYRITKAFTEKVRSMDQTRLLTFATHRPLTDVCLSLVDIVSINKYYGWYEGDYKKWPWFLEEMKKKLANEGLSHMPIIISEFGGAGIYGDTGFESRKWSEQYQQELLDYELKLFTGDPDIVGTYIWQYCDVRSAREMDNNRARSFNNKGLVNEYRKPKLAYWQVEKIYNDLKR